MIEALKKNWAQRKTVMLPVKIIPKSSTSEIVGFLGDQLTLKIKIKAVPEKNKANEELIKFLAKTFNLKTQQISIKTGHTSTRKIIEISQLP
jgi:hypothetical protein